MRIQASGYMAVVLGLILLVGLTCFFPAVSGAQQTSIFDKAQRCKADCNEAYGGLDIFPPQLQPPSTTGWSNCMMRCDRQFWKDFDRQADTKK
jgi:hypothetical protein